MKLTPSSSLLFATLALSAAAAPADPAGSSGMSASDSHNVVTDHEILTGHHKRQTGPTRTAPIAVGNPPANPGTGQIVVDVPIQAPGTGHQRREPQDTSGLPIAPPAPPTGSGSGGLPVSAPGPVDPVLGFVGSIAGDVPVSPPAPVAQEIPIQVGSTGSTNGSR